MEHHGDVTLRWVKDLLVVSVEGAFNVEGTEAAIKTYKKSVLDAGFLAWVQLEIWDGQALGGPDSMEKLPSIYNWAHQHGCIATAIVATNLLQRGTISTNLPHFIEVFYNQDEAIKWLDIQRGNK